MEIVAKARSNKVGVNSKTASKDLDSSAGVGDVAIGEAPTVGGRKGAGGAELAEFEAILEGYRKGAEEDLKLNAKANRAGKRAASRRNVSNTYQFTSTAAAIAASQPTQKGKAKATRGGKKGKAVVDEDSEDEDDDDEDEEEVVAAKPKKAPAAGKSKYTSKAKAAPAAKKPTRKTAASRKVVESSEEDDSD